MQDNFGACLAFTLKYEGGYSNHPADPGGPTNFGITQKTLAAWRGRPVSAQDVRALSVDEAGKIYAKNYWVPTGADNAPRGCDLVLFDHGVNAGPARAKAIAKKAGSMSDPALFIKRFSDARLSYLQGLRTWSVFGSGWGRRVGACEAQALKMTTSAPEIARAEVNHARLRAQSKSQASARGAAGVAGVGGVSAIAPAVQNVGSTDAISWGGVAITAAIILAAGAIALILWRDAQSQGARAEGLTESNG